tara:strand:+ start:399 stop:770 length:372 start_codon:yes stop_codon:yes gene_type:complete
MKKKKHTYKLGDVLKIRFFDGSIHTGEVTKLGYMGERTHNINYDLPIFTVTSKNEKGNNRPYTNYTSMTDDMVLEVNGIAKEPLYKKLLKKEKLVKSKKIKRLKKSELDLAIDKQKNFLRGKV